MIVDAGSNAVCPTLLSKNDLCDRFKPGFEQLIQNSLSRLAVVIESSLEDVTAIKCDRLRRWDQLLQATQIIVPCWSH